MESSNVNFPPTSPAPLYTMRPGRNFNPRKTARYGRPTFTPDVLVKYSPKYQYARLMNFPFNGSHFRPRMHTLVVSIDGGSRGNDRSNPDSRAAYAVYFGRGCPWNRAGRLEDEEPQTNGRAELRAAAAAMSVLEERYQADDIEMCREVILMTDAEYVAKGLGEWVEGWVKKGWRTAKGGEVQHRDLIEELHEKIKRFEVTHRIAVRFWRVGREWNGEADAMVNEVLDRSPSESKL